MYQDLAEAISFFKGRDIVAIRHFDQQPDHPTRYDGGEIGIWHCGDKRGFRFQMPKSGRMASEILADLFYAIERNTGLVIVDDLHRLLLRGLVSSRFKPPERVMDVSFAKAWLGMHDTTLDSLLKANKCNLAVLGKNLFLDLPRRARKFYQKHYLRMVRAYARYEMKPISVNIDGLRHKLYMRYGINESATGRLVTKGGVDGLFSPHIIRKDLRGDLLRAGQNKVLLHLDYVAAEIRTLAGLSGDSKLQALLIDGVDPYQFIANASGLAHISREQCKSVLIKWLYGATLETIASDSKVIIPDAKAILEVVFANFEGAVRWISDLVQQCSRDGHVMSYTGRIFEAPDGDTRTIRRKIVNRYIQGATADIDNLVFASLIDACSEFPNDAFPLIHLHDGFVIEVNESLIDSEAQRLTDIATQNPLSDLGIGAIDLKVKSIVADRWLP